jgi:hypothetical protein
VYSYFNQGYGGELKNRGGISLADGAKVADNRNPFATWSE